MGVALYIKYSRATLFMLVQSWTKRVYNIYIKSQNFEKIGQNVYICLLPPIPHGSVVLKITNIIAECSLSANNTVLGEVRGGTNVM